MSEQVQKDFLRKRMIELREKNHKSQSQMADILKYNKSTLSRAEKIGDPTSYKKVLEIAEMYCDSLGLSKEQKEQFLRGTKVVVVDTSALLKNTQLINELNAEYSKVIIPKVVVDELDNIKNCSTNTTLAKKAWEILRGISYGEKTILMEYSGAQQDTNNDCKIINIARDASAKFNCNVDIITEDTDYSAYLKGDDVVSAVHLKAYIKRKQDYLNMDRLDHFDSLYLDSYDDVERPTVEEANGYLKDGDTMIISAVRKNGVPFEKRKKKILWLISCGADVNKRDCSRRYFPPLTHAVQKNDYEMVEFLLKECGANPNIGSRDPFESGYVRHKNEGNMPLMVAAYHGREEIVRLLCQCENISINQQDGNGFTALMKACMNGNTRCRNILQEYNADERIVDINGMTFMDHYHAFLEKGSNEKKFNRGNDTRRQGRFRK